MEDDKMIDEERSTQSRCEQAAVDRCEAGSSLQRVSRIDS